MNSNLIDNDLAQWKQKNRQMFKFIHLQLNAYQ